MPGPPTEEQPDPLLERLRESASGDTAVRQLRRRYDILRQDYEALIDRLVELEERIADDAIRREAETVEATSAAPAPPHPVEPMTVAESLLAPLLRLRDEYLIASTGIQGIISGLDSLASSAFHRRFTGNSGDAETAPGAAASPRPAAANGDPPPFQVDVRGQGFGELLDFQERLAHLPGVARVSISAIDNERATLVVELDEPE